jgi:putative ATP-binding cassette transporter
MMFLPQRPYMPLGTLAQSLTYPKSALSTDRRILERALERVNLGEFIPQLGDEERWDRLMSLGQQQRLAFARLLVHKPKWIFLDEATSALDDDNQDKVMSIFKEELAGSTVLSIGHRKGLTQYHTRTLQLIDTNQGAVLRRRVKPAVRPRFWRRLRRLRAESMSEAATT